VATIVLRGVSSLLWNVKRNARTMRVALRSLGKMEEIRVASSLPLAWFARAVHVGGRRVTKTQNVARPTKTLR
jgi:hypothetical protein